MLAVGQATGTLLDSWTASDLLSHLGHSPHTLLLPS